MAARPQFFWACTLAIAVYLPVAAAADGVTESNYQHVDPEEALRADGRYHTRSTGTGTIALPGLVIAGNVALDTQGNLAPAAPAPPDDHTTIAILFEEDVCVVATQVSLDNGGVHSSVHVTFEFLARDGSVVDVEMRSPAGGTTRQAFSADSFTTRFAALRVTATARGAVSLSGVRALPCSFALS